MMSMATVPDAVVSILASITASALTASAGPSAGNGVADTVRTVMPSGRICPASPAHSVTGR